METFALRVIYQNEEVDVYKDIAFDKYAPLEDVHQTIVNSFGIESEIDIKFSLCDEDWNVVEHYDLDEVIDMSISDLIFKQGQRLKYENGFSEWVFDIELINIYETEQKVEVPVVLEEYGMIPETAPSDIHNPDTFLQDHTYGRYKKEKYIDPSDEDEEDDGYNDDQVDINDFF